MNFYAKLPLLLIANADILADQKYQLVLFLIFCLLEHTSTLERANNLLLFRLSIYTINFDKQHKPNRLLCKKQSYNIFSKIV